MNDKNKSRAALVIVALLFGVSIQTGATTVIALSRPDWLFLAADSMTSMDDKPYGTACKIHRFQSLFYAISGMPEEPNTRFDASGLVRNGFNDLKDFSGHVEATRDLLNASLREDLKWLKVRAPPETFRRITESWGPVLSVALAQFEAGNPRLAVLNFEYDKQSDSLNPKLEFTCMENCDHRADIFYLGSHHAIDALRNPDPKKFDMAIAMNPDLKTAFTDLIKMEIDGEPNRVGPPINILGINKDGATWFAGGEGCKL